MMEAEGLAIARRAPLLLLAAVITAGCDQTASPTSVSSPPGIVREYAEQHEFNRTVLVRHGDETWVHEAFGLADRAFGVPAALDTRYRIASITKLFTATLVLQLADQGLLDVAEPGSTYLPTYRDRGGIPVRALSAGDEGPKFQVWTGHHRGTPVAARDSGSCFEVGLAERGVAT